jgi:hypothetical protein
MSRVLDQAFEHPMRSEERASAPFAGGVMQHGYQCGMIWGAALAAGAQAYRLFGSGPQAESRAVMAAQRIVESFRTLKNHINCLEITEIDKSSTAMQMIMYFIIKGGTIGCFRMAAKYAPMAYEEITTALSEKDMRTPSPPVSCAAMLARKMGASDLHATMAAGFAGGIGLCGGACGALGAAIWISAMKGAGERKGKVNFRDPKALKTIDNFVKQTNFEFECSRIVGRKFDNVENHAEFLRNGGCADIIEVLAAE